MAMHIIWISVLSVVGGLARWGFVYLLGGASFSVGVLAVNVLGGAMAGWFYQSEMAVQMSSSLREGCVIGFLGAFTTFSAFSLDSAKLFNQSQWGLLGMYVFLNNVLSIGACILVIRWMQVR